jgi:hypothetical protein
MDDSFLKPGALEALLAPPEDKDAEIARLNKLVHDQLGSLINLMRENLSLRLLDMYAMVLRHWTCNPSNAEAQAAVTKFEGQHEDELRPLWERWQNSEYKLED